MEQIVVIENLEDNEIMFVLKIINYNYGFESVFHNIREIYERNCLETGWQNENGEEIGISFEDFILYRIEEEGYEYEFTGFEIFIA